jgi:transposase
LLTEAHGIPIAIAVDGANRHDMKLVCPTIEDLQLDRPTPTPENPQGLCLDKGYDYEQVRHWVEQYGFTAHIRARGEEALEISKDAGFRARRWVVERTHSWMNRFRGLLIRWPNKASNYLACLHLVCGIIAWRSAGLLG